MYLKYYGLREEPFNLHRTLVFCTLLSPTGLPFRQSLRRSCEGGA